MSAARGSPPDRRGGTGHTLAELLVVLVIVGLMAALVAPALGDGDGEGRRGAERVARALTERLERAHALAAATGTVVMVQLDPDDGRVWFATGEDDWRVGDRLPLDGSAALEHPVGRASFVFTPAGGAWGDDVTIRDAGGRRRVRVDPWTGEPRVDAR